MTYAPSPVGAAVASGIVIDPICSPDGPNETTVPAIVTAAPSKDTVAPPTAKELGAAVNVCPPTVKTDLAVGEAKIMVEPSITAPWSFEKMEMISPETVMGLPPALRTEPLGRVIAFR